MVMKAFVRHARWFALAALVMGLGDGVSARGIHSKLVFLSD